MTAQCNAAATARLRSRILGGNGRSALMDIGLSIDRGWLDGRHAAGRNRPHAPPGRYWKVCEMSDGTTISLAGVSDNVTVRPFVIDCRIVWASAREFTRCVRRYSGGW